MNQEHAVPLIAPVPRHLELTGGVFHPLPLLVDAVLRYHSGHGPVPGVDIIVGRAVSGASGDGESRRDAYEIDVDTDQITIRAEEQQGAFYAIMTLRQLLRAANRGAIRGAIRAEFGGHLAIPTLRIRDWPDFTNRGVMLDISRDRVPTMQTIYRLVDIWAELKINHVQLYTEHTFAYSTHRTVWKDASPFTADEIHALDAYCRERFIELVPNQNSFGHMERWLVHDEYRHMAECPDGWTDSHGVFQPEPFTLNPGEESTVPFLAGLYDELLPAFSSRQINVGCDETFDLGKGGSAEQCRTEGSGRVYLDFLNRVNALVRDRGRRMLYWGDIILHYPDLIPDLPADAIALTWGYEADHPFETECSMFERAGINYYVCPGTSGWNSIGGRWLNARANIANAAASGLSYRAIGLLNTEWGDNGHMQQFPIALPGFVYGAAVSWTLDASRELDVERVLALHIFDEGDGRLSRALFELATVGERLGPRLHNATILAAVLFDARYPYYRSQFPMFCAADFEGCRMSISQAIGLARQSSPGSADGELLRDEVVFTGSLMQHACSLAAARLSGDGPREIEDLPADVRRSLATELEPLIGEYRRLWLQRSRTGGLSDSIGRLERLLAAYVG